MKISQLEMMSFRSYQGVTLNLDAPRVLFAGRNGSGKTSLREALRWALTGACEGTDARGAGAEDLIPTGQTAAGVGLQIDGIGHAVRGYNGRGGSFSVDAFTGTAQVQQQALYLKLNTSPVFLEAALDTSRFLRLGHAEAKALVLALLNVKIAIAEGDTPQTALWTLDELDAKYRQAFEDRKVAKRTLQQLGIPIKPVAVTMPTVEAVEAQLGKLRGTLGELRQAVGSVAGKRQALVAELTRLDAVLADPVPQDFAPEIEALTAELAVLETAPPGKPVQPPKGDPQRVDFLRSRAEAIKAHNPSLGCVLENGVPCLTPQDAFSDRRNAIVEEVKKLAGQGKKSPPAPTESPLQALRGRLTELQRRQAQRTANFEAVKTANARQAAIREELTSLPDTAAKDAELAALQARIANGEQLLRQAREHWHAVGAYDLAVAKREVQEAEIARLEALCETLGPNGVRVQALATALGAFEAAVNPYVQVFGWTISFHVEPWAVIANGRPVETYSESEQFRLGLALQLGIAKLSGLEFAIVDRIDMLDAANRAAVTKMLIEAPVGQILILGTREPTHALPKGILAYRLAQQDGKTVITERSQA